MKKTMRKVMVPVSFAGTVEVEVPADIPPGRREAPVVERHFRVTSKWPRARRPLAISSAVTR